MREALIGEYAVCEYWDRPGRRCRKQAKWRVRLDFGRVGYHYMCEEHATFSETAEAAYLKAAGRES